MYEHNDLTIMFWLMSFLLQAGMFYTGIPELICIAMFYGVLASIRQIVGELREWKDRYSRITLFLAIPAFLYHLIMFLAMASFLALKAMHEDRKQSVTTTLSSEYISL